MRATLEKLLIGLKINKIIEMMTIADIVLLSGWGLISPILPVFFAEKIIGGGVALAGLASTAYLLTKSLVQIPVARYIDRTRGEWDDYWTMIAGYLTLSLSSFAYIWAKAAWHVIAIQIVYGLGLGFLTPGWLSIWSRYMDKNKEGSEWSLYSTLVGLSAAGAAGLGGLAAAKFGYKVLFVAVGIISLASTLLLSSVARNIKIKGKII